jgi:hypothetical protein
VRSTTFEVGAELFGCRYEPSELRFVATRIGLVSAVTQNAVVCDGVRIQLVDEHVCTTMREAEQWAEVMNRAAEPISARTPARA